MPRSTNAPASKAKRKRIFDQAKGYWGARKNVYTVAKNAVEKAGTYAYRDRKVRKRAFRRLWIQRVNAAARLTGTNYSQLLHALKQKQIKLNRKVLADLAMNQPAVFNAVVAKAGFAQKQ